jgi:hypothetical protein
MARLVLNEIRRPGLPAKSENPCLVHKSERHVHGKMVDSCTFCKGNRRGDFQNATDSQ